MSFHPALTGGNGIPRQENTRTKTNLGSKAHEKAHYSVCSDGACHADGRLRLVEDVRLLLGRFARGF
jgi:hypothetical protein